MADDVPLINGRSCDGCALCCKVLGIKTLDKPKGTWCQHCVSKQSCSIYESRPFECGAFYCLYRTDGNLGEEWKPSRSKMVPVIEMGGRRISIHVDPGKPDAWKKEPYYSIIKKWAASAAKINGQVLIYINYHIFAILPNKDVDLGIVSSNETIVTKGQMTSSGLVMEAFKIDKDDPSIQELAKLDKGSL